MLTAHLSPSAYRLRQQWETEDAPRFEKFREDEGSMQVINALAEMIVQAQAGSKIKTFPI